MSFQRFGMQAKKHCEYPMDTIQGILTAHRVLLLNEVDSRDLVCVSNSRFQLQLASVLAFATN